MSILESKAVSLVELIIKKGTNAIFDFIWGIIGRRNLLNLDKEIFDGPYLSGIKT